MRYISTRGKGESLSFTDTILTGLARDGGLFIPESFPTVTDRLEAWSRLSYQDLAFEIIRLFADDIPEKDLRDIIVRSYATFRQDEITPVKAVGPLFILELFHGPTFAFKDVALQFLGNLFGYVLSKTGREMNIVAATSGDTGSAAIYGVEGKERIRIFVMHPKGRVSPIQERQMTSVLSPNVHNIAVEGTFDDCQDIVKALFNDLDYRDRCHLGAVNSINWARVLAQVVYYFYAAFRVQRMTGKTKVAFTVPTGNFGDIFAGYVAYRMGLPVDRLITATNENDILARFFATGTYSAGTVAPTLSPSMDIQVASNFERYLYYIAGGDTAKLTRWMTDFRKTGSLTPDTPGDPVMAGGRGDTPSTLAAINNYWRKYNYLLDPHTAVGVSVAEQHLDDAVPMICLATAHPAKFGEAVIQAVNEDLAHHPLLDALLDKPVRCVTLPASTSEIGAFIEKTIRA